MPDLGDRNRMLLVLAAPMIFLLPATLTAQQFTEYLIPTPNSQPFAITPGTDGALWFTEYAASKIGRITTSGTFTEYPIPTANSVPVTLAVLGSM